MTSKENIEKKDKNGVVLIEICRERLNPELYHMRVGDVRGTIEHHNANKEDLIKSFIIELSNL